jgi:hypothetical protein
MFMIVPVQFLRRDAATPRRRCIRSLGRISPEDFSHAKNVKEKARDDFSGNYSGHLFFQRETRYSFPLRGKE